MEHTGQSSAAQAEVVDAFELAQQYNVSGHPENLASRTASRRSRRARNNVLSTVGICVSTDENGKLIADPSNRNGLGSTPETEKTSVIGSENDVGLWVGLTDEIVCLLSTNFATNLRQRFEVQSPDLERYSF